MTNTKRCDICGKVEPSSEQAFRWLRLGGSTLFSSFDFCVPCSERVVKAVNDMAVHARNIVGTEKP